MGKLINCRELLCKNQIDISGSCANLGHSGFWYYTSIDTANLIFENNCFHVRNISVMNDLNEAELHKNDSKFVHALCFCNSNTEKIPMWYLYSGIDGKGASIGFTSSVMRSLILSIMTVETISGEVLHIGSDFEIEYGWIFYQKHQSKSEVNYRRKWYRISDTKEFISGNFFVKDYPWEYEKEFRILIKNKTGTPYERIIVNLPEGLLDRLKLKFAPELDSNLFSSIISKYDGIQKYFVSKALFSNLAIKMDILGRNRDGLLSYISNSIMDEKSKISSNVLCEIIADCQKCSRLLEDVT